MIAVLINTADVRLGWVRVAEDCKLIKFGGANFVRTQDTAVMEDPPSEPGVVFVASETYVIDALDHFRPTSNFSKRQGHR